MRIVFDLDGTLIDSAPDIQAATNRMLVQEGAAPLDLATVISFIGNGLPKLVERAMQARDLPMSDHTRLSQQTLAFYNESPSALTRLYPGVKELLLQLRDDGHRLGLCTNKPLAPTQLLLSHMRLEGLFDCVVGGDSLAVKKPDPAPLLHTLEALGDGAPLYVGDSGVDAETARAAGVPFALFTQGYRKTPVSALPHAVAFDAFDAFPQAVLSAEMPAQNGPTQRFWS